MHSYFTAFYWMSVNVAKCQQPHNLSIFGQRLGKNIKYQLYNILKMHWTRLRIWLVILLFFLLSQGKSFHKNSRNLLDCYWNDFLEYLFMPLQSTKMCLKKMAYTKRCHRFCNSAFYLQRSLIYSNRKILMLLWIYNLNESVTTFCQFHQFFRCITLKLFA